VLRLQLVDDDTITSECAHSNKGLFTTPALSLDLRYLTWTNDGCINPPNLELNVEELKGRGLLGPAVTSNFELEEGQVVVFVFREVGDFSYANAEHRRVANPNPERAQTLGVPLDKLLEATSRLRPKDNPNMTKVSPRSRAQANGLGPAQCLDAGYAPVLARLDQS
jgi:hypothetical protein